MCTVFLRATSDSENPEQNPVVHGAGLLVVTVQSPAPLQ